MIYRLAEKKDVLLLSGMRWDFQTEFGEQLVCSQEEFLEHCAQFFNKSMLENNWFHWIIQDGDHSAGMVSVYRVYSIPKPTNLTPSWGYLTNTYIQPAYRNRGLGSELLQHVKTWAQKEHLELLIAWPS